MVDHEGFSRLLTVNNLLEGSIYFFCGALYRELYSFYISLYL